MQFEHGVSLNVIVTFKWYVLFYVLIIHLLCMTKLKSQTFKASQGEEKKDILKF